MAKITRTDAEWAYMLSKDGWSYDALRETWRREKDGKVEVGALRDGTFTARTFSLHYPFVCQEAEQDEILRGESHPEVEAMCDDSLYVEYGLRDMFAMHIINGMLAKSSNWSPKELALRSYEYADAMMVAREMKR